MAQDADLRSERGKVLAISLCAECHAIGATDISPHVGAPPFRALEKRLDLDSFIDRLRENLTSGHPDMPTFRFTRDDAQALIAYLRSIQGR
jgi:mono/diheme cytochrome c family protein